MSDTNMIKEIVKNTVYIEDDKVIIRKWEWGSCKGSEFSIFLDSNRVSIDVLCTSEHIKCIRTNGKIREIEIDMNIKHEVIIFVNVSYSCKYGEKRAFKISNGTLSELRITEEYERNDNNIFKSYYAVDDVKKVLLSKELYKRILRIYVKKDNEFYIIYGDTYHIKEILKRHGYKWNHENKTWAGTIEPHTFLPDDVEIVYN